MRKRESLGLTALAVLLVGGAALAYHLAVTDRREREAVRALNEFNAHIDRERAAIQPVVHAAHAFLGSLDGDDGGSAQLKLTSATFQARHRAAGGVLRYTPPGGTWFGAVNEDGPSFNDRWTGSIGSGALTCRCDILREGGGVSGSYTIALVRDRATGRWLVDAFAVSQ